MAGILANSATMFRRCSLGYHPFHSMPVQALRFTCRIRLAVWFGAVGVVASSSIWTARSDANDADLATRETAQKLIDATVTVRVVGAQDFVAASQDEAAKEAAAESTAENEVTVCSGTYVGENRLLSFGCLPVVEGGKAVKTEYRITLPAGGQATARPRVVDRYSGLVLLELEGHRSDDLQSLALADEVPQTASAVLTAAAAGLEEPLISQGVLSGVDRTVAGTDLPPLLVCDISTTPSSSGSALVNHDARLFGIVAAASLPGENFGWTYAVPLKHIQRVLGAEQDGQLVVLARMRPNLGVVLGPGADAGSVIVQHVDAGGPGERAGVVAGDQIVAIEGLVVRSVYQAGALIRKHLPGETITLTCRSPLAFRSSRDVEAGARGAGLEDLGAEAPAAEGSSLVRLVKVTLGAQSDDATISLPVDMQQQAIKARLTAPEQIEVSNAARSFNFRLEPAAASGSPPGAAPEPQENVLHAQLRQYEELIQLLRQDAERQRELLEQREKMVEALLRELQRLGREGVSPEDEK
jgi:S1-C subfamily serine protease